MSLPIPTALLFAQIIIMQSGTEVTYTCMFCLAKHLIIRVLPCHDGHLACEKCCAEVLELHKVLKCPECG